MGHDESRRQERQRFIDNLRKQGTSTKQIALSLCERYRVGPMTAFRWANGLSLAEAASRYNEVRDDPDEKMTGARISEWERWPQPRSRRPPVDALVTLSEVYGCHVGDLIDAPDHGQAEQPSAGSEPSRQDAAGEDGAARRPTLLRVLVTRRHWQTYETFVIQYERAAKELAEQDQDPRLRVLSITKRQFDRWLAGTVKTMPYPNHCRVLEYLFGYSVDELFSSASEPSAPTPPGVLVVSGLPGANGVLLARDQVEAPPSAPAMAGVSGVANTAVPGGGLAQDGVDEAVGAARRRAGGELARLRHAAGLNQQQLANRVGYSRGQVAGAEAGTQSTAVEFWRACDQTLAAGGALTAARGRVEAAMKARRDAAVKRTFRNLMSA